MSIGEAVTPLGLGRRASLGISTNRDDESPRGRRLRGRWRLHRNLQEELRGDNQDLERWSSFGTSDQPLALTSTPRHSWLRSRVGRCSVSPILVEDDEQEQENTIGSTCCSVATAAVEIDKNQPLELDRFSTTLFAANLEKMDLDDGDGVNNNVKASSKGMNQEECTSSTQQEKMKKSIKKTKKKARGRKSPHKSPNYKVDSRRFSFGATRKMKSPKDLGSKITKKKPSNVDLVSSSGSSRRTSMERLKGKGEWTSSPTWRRPKSPLLRTAERAKAKQYRQELRKQKEKQIEEMRQRILEEKRRQEEEEFQKLRQQTVFKAAPIRKYAPLPQVKKRPLTEPVSPNIRKRQRTDSSSRCCSSNRTD